MLREYGTGAIMAVPAHDQRDLEFARKYNLPVRVVVQPAGEEPLDGSTLTEAMSHEGVLVNSDRYDGLPATEEGIPRITADLEARGLGGPAVNFRLRDWLTVAPALLGLPDPDRALPGLRRGAGAGRPAAGAPARRHHRLPAQGPVAPGHLRGLGQRRLPALRRPGPARDRHDGHLRRLLVVLPALPGLDPERPFDPDRVAAWMPVHQYTGGIEHAILHLLYARFFTKVLYDLGMVGFTEPFTSLLNQGMVVMHGAAMSKSRGNLVEPSEIIDDHGADVARLTMLFAGPFEDDVDWADVSPEGMARWVQRVWRTVHAAVAEPPDGELGWPEDPELARLAHRTTAGVTDDLERFRFNTAISKLMVLSNGLADAVRAGRGSPAQRRDAAERLVLLLAPLAPFVTEELWRVLGSSSSVHQASWPAFDAGLVRAERVTCVVQVDGKVRDRVEVAPDATEDELRDLAMASERVRAALGDRQVARVVVVPPKLVNLVTGR